MNWLDELMESCYLECRIEGQKQQINRAASVGVDRAQLLAMKAYLWVLFASRSEQQLERIARDYATKKTVSKG